MKKRLRVYACICMLFVTFGGCQVSSKDFLAFEDTNAFADNSIDNQLAQGIFFAKDIVTIVEADNTGEDVKLSAGANLLVNITENEIIYADNVYDRLYPASLTKLMTALVVLEYGELTDQVAVSFDASHISEGGAKVCGYAEGDVISLEALLNSLLIYSGNDAAIAVADHISGSEEAFVKIMNEKAKLIGAIHTNYVNSNGLHDDNQYTTAYDIYLIFNELIKNDIFRSISGTDTYTAIYKDKDGNELQKTFDATNLYLRNDAELPEGMQFLGGKTGTTNKAGNCLVLLSKDTSEKEYISVILKAVDRTELYSQMTYLLSFTNAN